MAKVIEFPSGVDLLAAQARVGKHKSIEEKLLRLARFYVDMNHITGPGDIYDLGGRVPLTALEFVEQVCDTIGYHEAGQIKPGGNVA